MTTVRMSRFVTGLVFGLPGLVLTTVGGVVFAGDAALNGPSPLDLVGTALALAGAGLFVAAFRALFAGTSRRVKLLALPLVVLLAQFWVVPVLLTGATATNAPHPRIAPAASLGIPGAEDVSFHASDGVKLEGWYIPGPRGAAVVVLHGSHGTRASTRGQIRMLNEAGYRVLSYDARGHGSSSGHTNALGWYGDRDVAGAVQYLRARGATRVAALGLSMGAEEALRAAATHAGLAAVVADGAGASTQGDSELESGDGSLLYRAVTWEAMRTVEAFSGDHEPRALADVVSAIRVPILLIASGRPHEFRIDRIFRDRIGPRAQLWYVPDARHTRVLEARPAQYAQHVLRFLDGALG